LSSVSHSRSRSRSRSRNRDSSVDRQAQDKQTKSSASAGNATNAAQIKQEAHAPKEVPVPRTAPLPMQTRAVVNGSAKWPTTSPNHEIQIIGWEGGRVPVQHLVFSSDGKRLAIISGCLITHSHCCFSLWLANDMTVRMWETMPQARELRRCQVHTYVVAICWLQYDVGVLVLCSDGTTDIWGPEEKVSFEEKRTLELISFMGLDVDVAPENIVQCTVLWAVRETSESSLWKGQDRDIDDCFCQSVVVDPERYAMDYCYCIELLPNFTRCVATSARDQAFRCDGTSV